MTTRNLTLQEERDLAAQQAAEKRERAERAAEGFPQAGETWHCLKTGTMFAGRVLSRGDTFTITSEQIDSTFDRTGHSPLSAWGKPDAGIQPGPFPEHEAVLIHGSVDWQIARDAALERARRSQDPDDEYRKVAAEYGPPKDAVTWTELPDLTSRSKWSA